MRVRTLLIVNPRATTTTKAVRDKIVRTLAARADIEVVETRHRGNAREIAARAVAEGWDALLVLSGDGTINEAVNGLMDKASIRRPDHDRPRDRGRPAARAGRAAGRERQRVHPGPGCPVDPLAAVELIAARLAAGTTRTIGLGLAGDRYFTFNAGLGWDAEVDPRGGGAAGPGPPGLQPPVHAHRAAAVPAGRPAAPRPDRAHGGRHPYRPGRPGPYR